MLAEKMEERYLAYMLRLWRVGDDRTWRASLEDPRTNERYGFADLPALFAFLENLTAPPIAEEERPHPVGEAASKIDPQSSQGQD